MTASMGITFSECMDNVKLISNCSLGHMEQKCEQDEIWQMFRWRDIGQNMPGVNKTAQYRCCGSITMKKHS